jgi:hypothetical protein
MEDAITDGFGCWWPLCGKDCKIQVVGVGRAECVCEESNEPETPAPSPTPATSAGLPHPERP